MPNQEQGGEQRTFVSAKVSEDLAQSWRDRLASDFPEQNAATRESIVRWLLGKDLERLETLSSTHLETAQRGMVYRYRRWQRYIGATPARAYRQLMTRLSGSVYSCHKIRSVVATSSDRQRQAIDILQATVQELLECDRYIQQQIAWIAQCTNDKQLGNALLLATLEEYCLRPIRSQPLLFHHFVNSLRRNVSNQHNQMKTVA